MTKQYFVRKRYDTLHYSTVSERYDTLHVLYCTNPAMGTSGGLWGPMGVYGDLWGPMGTFGHLWGFMGTYGDGGRWGLIGI